MKIRLSVDDVFDYLVDFYKKKLEEDADFIAEELEEAIHDSVRHCHVEVNYDSECEKGELVIEGDLHDLSLLADSTCSELPHDLQMKIYYCLPD